MRLKRCRRSVPRTSLPHVFLIVHKSFTICAWLLSSSVLRIRVVFKMRLAEKMVCLPAPLPFSAKGRIKTIRKQKAQQEPRQSRFLLRYFDSLSLDQTKIKRYLFFALMWFDLLWFHCRTKLWRNRMCWEKVWKMCADRRNCFYQVRYEHSDHIVWPKWIFRSDFFIFQRFAGSFWASFLG